MQFGHLYLPQADHRERLPVVVMIHGGCWQDEYCLDPVGKMCKHLSDEGFAVWNIEYRRLGGDGMFLSCSCDK